MQIANRITLSMIGLVVLVTAVAGVWNYYRVAALILPVELNRLETQTASLAGTLGDVAERTAADLQALSHAASIPGVLRARQGGGTDPLTQRSDAEWRALLASLFLGQLHAHPDYLQARFLAADEEGHELVRVDRTGPGGSIRILPEAELQTKGNRDYFQSTLSLRPGERYVSTIDLNREQGKIELPQVPVLRVACPVYLEGDIASGVLIINVDMRPTFERLRRSQFADARLYVVNASGDYLLHPDPAREFGFDLGTPFRIQEEFPELGAALRLPSVRTDTMAMAGEGAAGVSVVPLRLGGGPEVRVVQILPDAVLMAPSRSVRNSSITAAMGALVLAVVLSVLVARTIVRPIHAITDATGHLQDGGTASFPVTASGEVGILARAFARMASEIRHHTESLELEIAQRRQAESQLEEHIVQLQLYGAIIESTGDAVVSKRLDGTITGWNPAAERMFGYTAQEALGKSINLIIPEDHREDLYRILDRIAVGESVVHYDTVRQRKDGSLLDVSLSVSPVKSPSGDVIGAAKIARDITARKQTEALFQLVVGVLPDALLITDPDGIVRFANQAAEALFGKRGGALLGESLDLPLAPGAASELTIAREGGDRTAELRVVDFRWEGRPAWLATLRDLTEHRSIEQQLRQAQKMEGIGQLAGGIAHDFNNLISVINGYSEMVIDALAEHPSLQQDVRQIEKAGERAAALTQQLLAFSRKQVLRPQVVDLHRIVCDQEQFLSRIIGENIKISIVAPPALDRILIDPSQVEQVVMNLAVNARDAMPDGGAITLELKNVELDEHYSQGHTAVTPGAYVMLAVSDTGEGMDKETVAKIFEPFFTTKERGKGTGLGLATVYGIVKQSGGFIYVYSEKDRGTVFKLYFPRVNDALALVAPQPDGPPANGTETVLVVEDEPSLRELTSRILLQAGYTVLAAPNAVAAQQWLRDPSVQPDLLLTDVILPGMSGPELAVALSHTRPDMRVLFISGYTDDMIARHGVLEPGIHFLNKPFSANDLKRKIRTVLDS